MLPTLMHGGEFGGPGAADLRAKFGVAASGVPVAVVLVSIRAAPQTSRQPYPGNLGELRKCPKVAEYLSQSC